MKVVYEYSHLVGSEIMQVRFPELSKLIYEAISSVTARRTKISQERTKVGRLYFRPAT